MAIPLWKCTIWLLWFIVTSYSVVHVQAGPLCLSCEQVARAGDCMHVIKCSDDETCYSQRHIGTHLETYFTLGCMDKQKCGQKEIAVIGKRHLYVHVMSQYPQNVLSNNNVIEELQSRAARSIDSITTCVQCCGTNFCNENLCGEQRSPIDQRCFSCDDVFHPEDCQAIQVCNVGYKCFVHEKSSNLLLDIRARFRLGCLPTVQCEGVISSFRNLGCAVCCTDAYCNSLQCANSSMTTATTATTTQRTLDASIQGPRSGNYNGSVTLTCSRPAASGYVWSFGNTGGSLPTGVVRDKETLTITNLNENTRGTYICSIILPTGQITSTNTTVVINDQPVYVTSVDHPHGHIGNGDSVVLTCHVTGWPVPTIEWLLQHVAGPLGQQNPISQVTFSDNNRVLTIASYVPSEYAGTWTCRGKNYNSTSGQEYSDSVSVTLH